MTFAAAFAIFMASHAYGPAQRNAVWQQSWVESRHDPRAVSPSGVHWGLFQWRDGRRAGLLRYARSLGRKWTEPLVQLEWLHHELLTLPGCREFFKTDTSAVALSIMRSFEAHARC